LRFDKKNKSFTLYEHDSSNFLSLKANIIPVIYKDRSGCYWFSASCKGLHKTNTIRKSVKFYFPNPFQTKSITDIVFTLCESKTGKIWIGTDMHGLLCFDKQTDKFELFQHDPNNPRSLSHNYVNAIIEDRNGFIWIGTLDGLNKYDPVSGHFENYRRTILGGPSHA